MCCSESLWVVVDGFCVVVGWFLGYSGLLWVVVGRCGGCSELLCVVVG